MKLDYDLYNILKYFANPAVNDNILKYKGNHVIVFRDSSGSGFCEVKVPTFFDRPVVVNQLSKFLKLFIYPKRERGEIGPYVSLNDWILSDDIDPKTQRPSNDMYLKMKGHNVKVRQGSLQFLDDPNKQLEAKFDTVNIINSVKFQLSNTLYKQILNDCSLLSLDTINFKSENEHIIKIILTIKDKGIKDNCSSYEIECEHEHFDSTVAIQLSAFNLIDAPDHQIEFGKFEKNTACNLVKIRSFYSDDYEVDKLILGFESKVK